MRITYHISIWLVLMVGIIRLPAQEVLSLEQALAIALENNYGIKVAAFNADQAETNAYLGATGALPSVNASTGGNLGFTRNTSITINQPDPETGTPTTEITGGDVTTYGLNAALAVNYVLALSNYTRLEVLQTTAAQSKESLYLTTEQTLSQLSVAYYNLARQLKLYELQARSLERSRKRLTFVQNQADLGQSNSVNLLNAQVDINTDSINLVSTQANVTNAKRDLNFLLGRDVETDFRIETGVELGESLSLITLTQDALAQNSSLKIADYNRKISNLNLKVARQAALPSLSLSGSYAYNFSDNGPVSILTQQSSDGLTASGSISVPIFNGHQIKRNIQSAEIGVASSQYNYKQAEQQVIRDLNKAYATYENNQRVMVLSEKSLEAAQLNFSRTEEAFRLGQASGVQFREAQLNLARVENQLNDYRFTIKQNEIELLRLSGQLVNEE